MSTDLKNYDLIYVNLNGLINIVKKDVWENNNSVNLTGGNITKVGTVTASKITQLNNGQYIYLGENCKVYLADKDFKNIGVLSEDAFSSVTQLSDYKILLTTKAGKLYYAKDINNFKPQPYYDDGLIYSSVKQTGTGKLLAIEGTQCGTVYSFDVTRNIKAGALQNRTKVNLDDGITNRVTIFVPNQTQLLTINCDPRAKETMYKYPYTDKVSKSNFSFQCDLDEDYNPIDKLCYKKCREGYEHQFNEYQPTRCKKVCNKGDIDTPETCIESCRSGYTNKAGVCWNNKTLTYDRGVGTLPKYSCPSGYNLDGITCRENCRDGFENRPGDFIRCWNEKKYYDRGVGIAPDYGSCNTSGLSDVKYYAYTCTGCKKKDKVTKVCYEYATRDRNKECKSNREMKDGLCYEKPKDGYTCTVTGCSPNPLSYEIKNKESTKTCSSEKKLEAGLCYEEARQDYDCKATSCQLDINLQSYVPKTYNRDSYDIGVGKKPGNTSEPITCSQSCCQFDLAFRNNMYYKPAGLTLPTIPITSGLLAYYNATSFSQGILYDLTENNNHAVFTKGIIGFANDNNQVNTQTKGSYLVGDVNSGILFPANVLPDNYTMFSIVKYNGKAKEKILAGYDNSWVSGFSSGKSGIASRNSWVTQEELSVFDDRWVFSTDTNDSYRANGNDYTVNKNSGSGQLSLNYNENPSQNSDWAVACVIVFNRVLTSTEISSMESWIQKEYGNLWGKTYSTKLSDLGYSCFGDNIGKVVDDGTRYVFASYGNGNIPCKWLNFPQKGELNDFTCTPPTLKTYKDTLYAAEVSSEEESDSDDVEAFGNILGYNSNEYFASGDDEEENIPSASTPTTQQAPPVLSPSVIQVEETEESLVETEEPDDFSGEEVDSSSVQDESIKLCRSAFDYYDLYKSSNPYVIKGNDINYTFKNNIISSADLIKLGNENSQTFNKFIPNYNPNNIEQTKKAIDELFKNTPLKLGCCFRNSATDNTKKSVVVRTPLNPYDTDIDPDLLKFDFKFKTLDIPEGACPATYYGNSLDCNTLYDVYCRNMANEFNKNGFTLDDFKKYAPECACYAPKYDKEKIYPDNTPPACYKQGCENRNNIAAYVDPLSRNNPCDITVCQNILNLENVKAGGNVTVNAKLENTCGEYIPGNKSTDTIKDKGVSSETEKVDESIDSKTGTPSTTPSITPSNKLYTDDKEEVKEENNIQLMTSNNLMIVSVSLVCSCIICIIIIFIFMSGRKRR